MVIYADVLFLINIIFDFLTLIILGKSMKLSIRKLRVVMGSAVGAAGTVVIFALEINSALLKAALAFVMIICAYGWAGRKMISRFAVFLLITASTSGIAAALISLIPTGTDSVIKNGIIYFDISGRLFLLILLAVYPILCILSKGIKSRVNRRTYMAEIKRDGRSVAVNALFDSGNTLKEPITGRPVVIAEWNAVKGLFENPVEFELLSDKMEDYKLWIVPYHALGKKQGRIFAFMADRIQIEEKVTERIFIGVTDQKLSEEYKALLNAELI